MSDAAVTTPMAPAPPEAVRAQASEGELEAARRALVKAAEAANARGKAWLPWAALAEELGAFELALGWLQKASQEAPEVTAIAQALRALEADLGVVEVPARRGPLGTGSAGESLALDDTAEPGAPGHPELAASTPVPAAEDGDVVRFVHRFVGREGVHARQWVDGERGGYSPVRRPLTPDLARAHLSGEVTLGTYVVRLDDTVTFFVVDVDARKAALEASAEHRAARQRLLDSVRSAGRTLQQRLAALAVPTLMFDSGHKGCHLWGLLAQPLPAALVHKFGKALRRVVPGGVEWSVEVFPKQGAVAPDGLGNLVKLPLGVHRRSGRWAVLLGADGRPVADPWSALRAPPLVEREALLEAFARLQQLEAPTEPGAPGGTEVVDRALGEAVQPAPVQPRPSLGELVAQPAMARAMGGCAVVRTLVEEARETRRLSHDAQVVLLHSLAHDPAGVALLQGLFAHCPEVPLHAQPKRVLRGHPVSCARIRARLPHVTQVLPCHCRFDTTDRYPSPALYVDGVEGVVEGA